MPICILLATLLPSACSNSPVRRFPIGIFDVDEPRHLRELKKMGFDSIETGNPNPAILEALAKTARKRKLGLFVYPHLMIERNEVLSNNWPIEAWYLQDEPDVHRTPPLALEQAASKVRDWDAKTPLAFVVGQGSATEKYGHIGDILLLDWYPVPHLPLDSVADHIDLALKGMPPGKPLWMIVQAFDWRDFTRSNLKNPKVGRFPNFDEIRFMTYISIVHGASGIYYYTLRKPNGKTLFDYPEQFLAVGRVTRELNALQPIFERGQPVDTPFAALDKRVEMKSFRYKSRDYVIVVNRSGEFALPYPEQLRGRRWRPLFEPRRNVDEALLINRGNYFLRPHQVLVLESAWNSSLEMTK